jgi:hypothetical protein
MVNLSTQLKMHRHVPLQLLESEKHYEKHEKKLTFQYWQIERKVTW